MATTLVRDITFQISVDLEAGSIEVKADLKNKCTMTEFTVFASTILEDMLKTNIEKNESLTVDQSLQLAVISDQVKLLRESSTQQLEEIIEAKEKALKNNN
jgi:hypothetical protein